MAYSMDLRIAVSRAYDESGSSIKVAKQGRPDVKAARDVWFEQFADVLLSMLVLLDEFGTITMQRSHGRAAPGERVAGKLPHGHWKMISTISAMSINGIIASASLDGTTNTELFVIFIRNALLPALKPGQVVVMDNLPTRRSAKIDRRVESVGVRVLRLPPYSLDFNPIEMAVSKVKAMLRKHARKSVDQLFDGIGEALASIRTDDAFNYIAHCGYARERRKPL